MSIESHFRGQPSHWPVLSLRIGMFDGRWAVDANYFDSHGSLQHWAAHTPTHDDAKALLIEFLSTQPWGDPAKYQVRNT